MDAPMTGTDTGHTAPQAVETNRARVRRLLLDPLGFRSDRRTDPADERRFLDALADELAYMADGGLRTLAAMLATKGTGTARNFWPDLATFRGFAEVVQPRPLADLPALRRWFGSIEGPRAQAEGTLVETFQYFQRHKAPPFSEGARRLVLEQAEQNARRLRIVTEKRAAGIPVPPEEADWARHYQERRAYVDELVRIERDAKGGGV